MGESEPDRGSVTHILGGDALEPVEEIQGEWTDFVPESTLGPGAGLIIEAMRTDPSTETPLI